MPSKRFIGDLLDMQEKKRKKCKTQKYIATDIKQGGEERGISRMKEIEVVLKILCVSETLPAIRYCKREMMARFTKYCTTARSGIMSM